MSTPTPTRDDELMVGIPTEPLLERLKSKMANTPEVVTGMADFRAQFEQFKLAEAGIQQARQAFEQYKAEQQLAKDLAAQAAQVLAKQLEDAERKRQADQERKQPKPGRDGPGFPR